MHRCSPLPRKGDLFANAHFGRQARTFIKLRECCSLLLMVMWYPRGEAEPSKIFAFTESSQFKLKPELKEKLKRNHEIPDKVFGLRMSGTLNLLLKQKDKREQYNGKTLEQVLLPTLFPQDHSPTVFPFLVGESKSESSACSMQEIHQQLAIVINESLLIQDNLRQATGSTKWIAGPLVWCFVHRGSSWQVSAGYIPEGKKRVKVVSNLPPLERE